PETPKASATLDPSSLVSSTSKPTITGTFSNLNGDGIGLFIATQPLPAQIPPNGPSPSGVVFSDASDHGGGVNMSSAENLSGTYSDALWQSLPNGTYYIGIYETSTDYNS